MMQVHKTPEMTELRQHMLVRPEICTERAKLITEVFRETEGMPAAVRRGMAFAHVMRNMTVSIYPGEQIVGHPTSKVRGGSISPELDASWILDELDLLSTRSADPFQPLTEEDKAVLRDVVPYWKERCLCAHWKETVGEENLPYDDNIIGGGAYCANNQFPGHSAPDYSLLLKYGTDGLAEKVQASLQKAQTQEQRDELQGMLLSLQGLGELGIRYAAKARELAETETDPLRHTELLRIAETCEVVPKYPARTFREAIQSVWLGYIGVLVENWGTGNTFLRIDQYLYPYYLHSKAAGMTDQEAYNFLVMLLINCNSCCVVYSEKKSHGFAGNNSGCSFTIGGVKPDGTSAVNEVSYLILEAERTVNMGSDDVVVRIDDNIPEDFLHLACEVARDNGGKLKFLGDKTAIADLMYDGMPIEDARDYAIAGCTSPEVAGRNYNIPGGIISLPTILELALRNGVHRATGLQLGAKTGDAAKFASYDELWNAFCTQVTYVMPHLHAINNADKAALSKYMPSPLQSSLYPICVERGMDVIDGGTKPYYFFAMALGGAPNVGDSLAAIKKLVYEEKRVTMAEILQALDDNYEGHEDLRQLLLRQPKFGNDDPYVDTIVNDVLTFASDTMAKEPGYHNAKSIAAAAAVTANVGLGMLLGATPDGRLAGEPISEGGISPYQGRNTSGTTATMLSVAHLDHSKIRHGEVLNMRLNPDAVEGEDKLRKFEALIKAYMREGGFLVQFNIVSTETLRDAQVHPEEHRDLVVRVATYAAYFIELGKELQDDIIHRLEFSNC